ncbi:MAG TPA: transcription antitermination factor NusB [Actinomycetota bacterium]|jgi:N utilization substance protein B
MVSGAEGEPSIRTTGHRRRRAARRKAIDILYQADVTERSPRMVMNDWQRAGRTVPTYTETLVAGVERSLPDIDALLATNSEGWTVHRMAVVDRTILRVACYELRSGVPTAVAINEAVDAAKRLSTEDSGRFINGVLGRIARNAQASPETGPRA